MIYSQLFFDLDHTLWDFETNSRATLQNLYDTYELDKKGINDFQSFYLRYLNHNDLLWTRFRNGFIKRDELRWKRIWLTMLDFRVYDTAMVHEMSTAYLELLPKQTKLFPDVEQTLRYCQNKGYRMHLITNGFEVTQRQKLQNSGIAPFFTEIFTSERCMSPKPHCGIFEFAEKTTGAKKTESLMIGDALAVDILGARNAGWDQVYFNPNQIPHEDTPTYEICSIKELCNFL